MRPRPGFDSGGWCPPPQPPPTKYVAIMYKYKMMVALTGKVEIVSDTMIVEQSKFYSVLSNLSAGSCFDINFSDVAFTLTNDPR